MNTRKRVLSAILATTLGASVITPCYAFNLKKVNKLLFRAPKKITYTPWLKKVFNKVFFRNPKLIKPKTGPLSSIGKVIVKAAKSGFFTVLGWGSLITGAIGGLLTYSRISRKRRVGIKKEMKEHKDYNNKLEDTLKRHPLALEPGIVRGIVRKDLKNGDQKRIRDLQKIKREATQTYKTQEPFVQKHRKAISLTILGLSLCPAYICFKKAIQVLIAR
ncbi:hypothetical protein ACFLYU_03255 [Candidatus Dependentiae bacterium]